MLSSKFQVRVVNRFEGTHYTLYQKRWFGWSYINTYRTVEDAEAAIERIKKNGFHNVVAEYD